MLLAEIEDNATGAFWADLTQPLHVRGTWQARMPPTTWNGRTPDTDACAFASVLPGQLPDPTRAAPDTAWNAEYLGRAVAALRDSGQTVDDELLAHISPAMTEPVRLHGTYSFDVDRELAELDPAGYRPLRAVAPNEETT